MIAEIPSMAIVSGTQVRAVDGTAYWILTDSPFEYFLHPVFLRWFLSTSLVYVFLDSTDQGNTLDVWAYALVFSLCSVVILLWLCGVGALLAALARNGRIGFIYTPVLLVPMVALGELTGQAVIEAAGGIGWHSLSKTLVVIGRDTAVILLFDYLHGQFVTAAHPLARTHRGTADLAVPTPTATAQTFEAPSSLQPLPPEASQADRPPALPAPDPVPPRQTGSIRVGSATLALADIVMIRTEDHYLGITTRTGKTLQRAKLSDLTELHEAGIGMQINRSVWIAFSAIATVEDAERGQVLVTLTNGEEERVAKPRVFAFRQMYRGT